MPGKKGRKGGGRRDSCIIPFHFNQSGAFTAGVVPISATPLLTPRLTLEADIWAHFRFRSLSMRLLPTSPSTAPQAVGFVGGVEDTSPTTFAQVSELIPCSIKGVGQTTPSSWIKVPRIDLAGPFPWYKTVAGTADAMEEAPGLIVVVGTGTEAYNLELKGKMEFKVGLNSTNTPAEVTLRKELREMRAARVRDEERKRLIRVLSTTEIKKSTP